MQLKNSGGEDTVSFHYNDPMCFKRIHQAIYRNLVEQDPFAVREPAYVCIGTDRATGDCLGPLVGSRLGDLLSKACIYGTLEKPAHAVNLSDTLDEIARDLPQAIIVAIDACLGKVDRIGFINVKKGSLQPGTALNKDLPAVGDFHVSGVVNVGGLLDHLVLQNTRLYVVYQMAQLIAEGITAAHMRYLRLREHSAAPFTRFHPQPAKSGLPRDLPRC